MLRLLADENIKIDIVQGLLRRKPDLDLVRVQEVGLSGVDDPVVLAWAAQAERVLITHDKKTMLKFAYARIATGQPMPGVFAVKSSANHREVIEGILLLSECSFEHEWADRIVHVPM